METEVKIVNADTIFASMFPDWCYESNYNYIEAKFGSVGIQGLQV